MIFKLFLMHTTRRTLKSTINSYVLIENRKTCLNKIIMRQQQQHLHIKTYDNDAGLIRRKLINDLPITQEIEEIKQIKEIKSAEKVIGLSDPASTLTKNNTKNVDDVNRKTDVDEHFKETSTIHKKLDDFSVNENPDIFGSHSDSNNGIVSPQDENEDEGDKIEEAYISRPTRHMKKLRTIQYARLIKDHLNNHRIKEAINVLEIQMLQEDRVKPDHYIYSLLISGCAKAGYTRKCFQLFTKMLQRGLKIKEGIFTSLFNACANASSSREGLSRMKKLRIAMLNRGHEPNLKMYNAMIKAYGRCGDVKTAYLLADEMQEKRIPFTAETYNFLLQACASDEEYGFRHCLLTWHKMMQNRIQPDYYSFNAVLRCTRDCNIGDLESMKQVLEQILHENQSSQISITNTNSNCDTQEQICFDNQTTPQLQGVNPFSSREKSSTEGDSILTSDLIDKTTLQVQSLQQTSGEQCLELPNLLLSQPHLGSMLKLEEIKKPHERFLLLGGLNGFLHLMKSYGITPDIETFTTMLEVLPPTNTAEKQLLAYVRKIGLKADIDFFNILIKKRAMRFDYEGGKEVLTMIKTAGLHPDIVTYGVLALGCTTVESSRELLQKMTENGIRMNIEILGAMLRQGCARNSFPYICEIIQISLDENIRPNDIFLRHLHHFYKKCARAIDSRHPWTKEKHFKRDHMKFCNKYRLYQEEHKLLDLKLEDAIKILKQKKSYQLDEVAAHDYMEPLKNEKFARKQKIRKYIKKIKIQNLKGDEAAAPSI